MKKDREDRENDVLGVEGGVLAYVFTAAAIAVLMNAYRTEQPALMNEPRAKQSNAASEIEKNRPITFACLPQN